MRIDMLIAVTAVGLMPYAQADNPPPPAAAQTTRIELGIGIAGAQMDPQTFC